MASGEHVMWKLLVAFRDVHLYIPKINLNPKFAVLERLGDI